MTSQSSEHQTSKYINRELSWLEFNERVLEEALDETNPLLERTRFLAISSTNLDEFFMVRVGGLHLLNHRAKSKKDIAGLIPADQLKLLLQRVNRMVIDQYTCFSSIIEKQLNDEGIKRIQPDALSDSHLSYLDDLFENELYPIITPMAVGVDASIPLLRNRALILCARIAPNTKEGTQRYVFIPIPGNMRRIQSIPSNEAFEYILLEDIVHRYVNRFFPGETVEEAVPFRITRNADLAVSEDLASDLLSEMQHVLQERKVSDCVRLEINHEHTSSMITFLQHSLDVQDDYIFSIPGPLDLSSFSQLTDVPSHDHLCWKNQRPQQHPDIDPTASMFDTIRKHDVLLHHPYESYEPIVRLINEAADDPDVIAIKQILYRTSKNSPIVEALKRAARNGKNVTALVELRARFDEERNIEWARDMERDYVQVIYGIKGLKTHAKVCIIIRREPQGIQRYIHFGTGNYNEITARLYTDISFMTCDENYGSDATTFFNTICGYTQPQSYDLISAAPIGLRNKLLSMIETEIEHQRQGRRSHIMCKMNSLADKKIIDALYKASQKGVRIDLNVRGICCLRPGVPGLSDNISVVSIVGRYLEHSRIYYFRHGGSDRVMISSADCMPRNLDRRIELLVNIENTRCKERLIDILQAIFKDNTDARRILPDGTHERISPSNDENAYVSQHELYRKSCEAAELHERSTRSTFEPYRAPTRK